MYSVIERVTGSKRDGHVIDREFFVARVENQNDVNFYKFGTMIADAFGDTWQRCWELSSHDTKKEAKRAKLKAEAKDIGGAEVEKIYRAHIAWRDGAPGGKRADFRGVNLEASNFKYAFLRKARLQNAYLCFSDVSFADLRGANLRCAILVNCNLHQIDLRDANLNGANLQDSNLLDADLRGADLRGANFTGSNLRGADFRGAKTEGAIGL